MIIESLNFRSEIFENPREYEETLLRDRKSNLYNLLRNDEKAEFIRDVIALANSARRIRKPAYLILGITDDGKISDLNQYLNPYKGNNHNKNEQQIGEAIRHQIGLICSDYIDPKLTLDIKWGEKQGKQVAYILIEPDSNGPFRVKKKLKNGEDSLQPGQCWIRFGESKQEIKTEEITHSNSLLEKPFTPPSFWREYTTSLLIHRNIQTVMTIEAYQDLYTNTGESLDKIIKEFTKSNTEKLLAIIGYPGNGKSTFVKRLIIDKAKVIQRIVKQLIQEESFQTPPEWIPVYFPLRGKDITNTQHLFQLLDCTINQLANEGKSYNNSFLLTKNKDLNCLIIFDGLDEINGKGKQESFLVALEEILLYLDNLKVILTTRPDISLPQDMGKQIEIAHLETRQIRDYLSYYHSETEERNDIMEILQSNQDLTFLASIPVCLEAIADSINDNVPIQNVEEQVVQTNTNIEIKDEEECNQTHISKNNLPKINSEELEIDTPIEKGEVENSEEEKEKKSDEVIFTPVELMDKIYMYLLNREKYRIYSTETDIKIRREIIGEIAWEIGEKDAISFKQAQELLDIEGLKWILSTGILQYTHPGENWICFIGKTTQYYFAASLIEKYIKYDDRKGVRPYFSKSTKEFLRNVYNILKDITYKDIDPYFKEVLTDE